MKCIVKNLLGCFVILVNWFGISVEEFVVKIVFEGVILVNCL